MTTLPPVKHLVSHLLGLAFNWSLQGAMSVQVYIYYLCFPQDAVAIKLLVYVMCIYEWIQTALATVLVVHVVRFHSDTVSAVVTTDGGWVVMFIMPAFAAAGVQSFYAWRIYVLSQRQKIFPIVVLGCAVTALCAGVIGAVNLKAMAPIGISLSSDEAFIWDVATNIWLWGSIITDTMIATFMIRTLRRFQTFRGDSNLLINRFIKLVIETGCVTVIGAIITLVLWFTVPSTLLAALPLMILSKLYANTLMVTLNNRAFMNAHPSEYTVKRSPLVLHMTSRQSDGLGSNVVGVGTDHRVEVTLPPTTDVDAFACGPTK